MMKQVSQANNKFMVSAIKIGVGLAISSSPIFMSAHAENLNSSASVVLELQTLRSEIADLRDMVERQGYQLKRLQQELKEKQLNTTKPERLSRHPLTNVPVAVNPQIGNDVRVITQQQDRQQYNQQAQDQPGVGQDQHNTNAVHVDSVVIPNQARAPENGQPTVEERIVVGKTTMPHSQQQAQQQSVVPTLDVIGAPATRPAQTISNEVKIEAAPATVSETVASSGKILSEETYYKQGFDFLKASEHVRAVTTFEALIANYPQGDLVDDAHYWVAESKYVNSDFDSAKVHFKTIIDQYKQSLRLPDAMLKLAFIEQKQDNSIEAKVLLQEIIRYHPKSNAAISAKNRLAQFN